MLVTFYHRQLNNTGHAIVLTNDIMSNTAASLLLQVTSCPVQLPHHITTAAAALLCSLIKLDTLLYEVCGVSSP